MFCFVFLGPMPPSGPMPPRAPVPPGGPPSQMPHGGPPGPRPPPGGPPPQRPPLFPSAAHTSQVNTTILSHRLIKYNKGKPFENRDQLISSF